MNSVVRTSTPLPPVCVIGLGLIGGSILQDLRKAKHPCFGYDPDPQTARLADASHHLLDTLHRCAEAGALIVLACPVPALSSLLHDVAKHAPNCGFTDVGSVKGTVAHLVDQLHLSHRWVGSHPMAGTAGNGWEAAQTSLFSDAAWVVCTDQAPYAPTHWKQLFSQVIGLAQLLGAQPVPAHAHNHDAAVASVSHLPHLLADALAIVGHAGGNLALSLAAGSFTDGTRVAGSPVPLQRALCENNAPHLLQSLDQAIELLTNARDSLAAIQPSVDKLVAEGHRARSSFASRRQQPRPITAIDIEADDWWKQLDQAESQGSAITLVKA